MIQIVKLENGVASYTHPKLLVPMIAMVFKRLSEIHSQLALSGMTNIYFTASHHEGAGGDRPIMSPATLNFQSILPFEFKLSDEARVGDVIRLLATKLACPTDAITVIKNGPRLYLIINMRRPIRDSKSLTIRSGAYADVARSVQATAIKHGYRADANLDAVGCDMLIPLPGTMANGQLVELLQYSEMALSTDVDKAKTLRVSGDGNVFMSARQWIKENLESDETPRAYIPTQEVYERYTAWVMEQGRRKTLSKARFSGAVFNILNITTPEELRTRCIAGRSTRVYPGIKFKTA